MVDVSHASDATARDAIAASSAPVIASHSGARAVYDHPRNLPDELLRAIAATGGVVQVNGHEQLSALARAMGEIGVSHPQPLAEISDVAAHIDYIARLVGVDHVGVGSDFDGGGGVRGLLDAADYPNLTRELARLGYGQAELERIWGGNLLRVLRANEHVAARLAAEQACVSGGTS